jgi:hypothetical protein
VGFFFEASATEDPVYCEFSLVNSMEEVRKIPIRNNVELREKVTQIDKLNQGYVGRININDEPILVYSHWKEVKSKFGFGGALNKKLG